MKKKIEEPIPHPPKISWHISREPEVLSARIDEPNKPRGVKGKKQVILGLMLVGLVILAGAGLYYYIIPRVEVELITVYHEGAGGASSGGFINVNTKVQNTGTKTLEDVNVTLKITKYNSEKTEAKTEVTYYNIGRGENREPKLDFMGDHYEPYTITLKIQFTASGNNYEKEFTYEVEKDSAMNLIFEDSING